MLGLPVSSHFVSRPGDGCRLDTQTTWRSFIAYRSFQLNANFQFCPYSQGPFYRNLLRHFLVEFGM